jgi:hypothetical protein
MKKKEKYRNYITRKLFGDRIVDIIKIVTLIIFMITLLYYLYIIN